MRFIRPNKGFRCWNTISGVLLFTSMFLTGILGINHNGICSIYAQENKTESADVSAPKEPSQIPAEMTTAPEAPKDVTVMAPSLESEGKNDSVTVMAPALSDNKSNSKANSKKAGKVKKNYKNKNKAKKVVEKSDDEFVMPQEWDWFSAPLKFIEDKKGNVQVEADRTAPKIRIPHVEVENKSVDTVASDDKFDYKKAKGSIFATPSRTSEKLSVKSNVANVQEESTIDENLISSDKSVSEITPKDDNVLYSEGGYEINDREYRPFARALARMARVRSLREQRYAKNSTVKVDETKNQTAAKAATRLNHYVNELIQKEDKEEKTIKAEQKTEVIPQAPPVDNNKSNYRNNDNKKLASVVIVEPSEAIEDPTQVSFVAEDDLIVADDFETSSVTPVLYSEELQESENLLEVAERENEPKVIIPSSVTIPTAKDLTVTENESSVIKEEAEVIPTETVNNAAVESDSEEMVNVNETIDNTNIEIAADSDDNSNSVVTENKEQDASSYDEISEERKSIIKRLLEKRGYEEKSAGSTESENSLETPKVKDDKVDENSVFKPYIGIFGYNAEKRMSSLKWKSNFM